MIDLASLSLDQLRTCFTDPKDQTPFETRIMDGTQDRRPRMLQEYPTTKCSRKCGVTGESFRPDEEYYSVVVTAEGELRRVDISANHWVEPPVEAIGWWKCRMPARQATGLCPAPTEVLLDTLSELLRQPDQGRLAYILALLLVRRRVLVEDLPGNCLETVEEGSTWNLNYPPDGRQWQVPELLPESTAEFRRLQTALIKLLFTEV